jgi:hypothetical protein
LNDYQNLPNSCQRIAHSESDVTTFCNWCFYKILTREQIAGLTKQHSSLVLETLETSNQKPKPTLLQVLYDHVDNGQRRRDPAAATCSCCLCQKTDKGKQIDGWSKLPPTEFLRLFNLRNSRSVECFTIFARNQLATRCVCSKLVLVCFYKRGAPCFLLFSSLITSSRFFNLQQKPWRRPF